MKLIKQQPRTKALGRHRLLATATALACTALAQSAFAQQAQDYAGFWSFNDCSSSFLLKDSSINNASATRGNQVLCAPDANGRAGGAVNFVLSKPGDGSTATNVTITNTQALALSNKVSLSARIKPSATPGGAILTKGWSNSAGPQKTFQLAIQKDSSGVDRLTFTIWMKPTTGTTAVPVTLTSNVRVAPSAQIQVGAAYDPAEGLSLFINGKKVAAQTETRLIADAAFGAPSTMWLGGGAPGQTRGYLGTVDDVWISTGACGDLQSGHTTGIDQELMITHLDVVNDPARTNDPGRANAVPHRGAWTFANLIEQMVPATPSNPQLAIDAAADMVEAMFSTWKDPTTNPGITPNVVNGFTLAPRDDLANGRGVRAAVLNAWPRLANNKLDLTRAPLRLLAIVNRLDQRNLEKGQAGEGRFVFGVLTSDGFELPFTLILEYKLPAVTDADVRIWARDWHALGTLPVGSPNYNDALQGLTDRFTARGAAVGTVNGSALNQLRTNEIALNFPWELRQFELAKNADGSTRLKPAPVALTPDIAKFNNPGDANSALLVNYINSKATDILAEKHTMPLTIGSSSTNFVAGAARNNPDVWNPPLGNTAHPDLRHKFAVNTCNGCHSGPETRTSNFLHVANRGINNTAQLSKFLTGLVLADNFRDPISNAPRTFNDLGRRQTDMNKVLATCPLPAPAPSLARTSTLAAPAPVVNGTPLPLGGTARSLLPAGIGRVH
ncbi:MAG: hypothetical protein EOP38_18985 [Rubrivivax sp.]|nr:MAG: hypothetical protein EOP38_18985 [Rubrivivax sp.]